MAGDETVYARDWDSCVVDTAPLSALVTTFVKRWGVRHGTSRGEGARARPDPADRDPGAIPMGPIEWLSETTGVPKKTISNVVSNRRRTTEFRIADALVAAIDQPQVFHDDTLTVRPNPNAPKAIRAKCCGGSLTGQA